jgi:hypothetical protein
MFNCVNIPTSTTQTEQDDMSKYQYSICRSSTGKYHLTLGSATAMCNGRSGRFAPVHIAAVDYAPDHAFCEKCFTESPKLQIARMREIDALV